MSDGDRTRLRTLVIGLDAGCLNVIDPFFDEGALPNLKQLFDDGVSGTLSSQIPPWTASAWPSLYTGTNPGKHGIFDFMEFDGYDWDIVNATHIREPTIWELLNAKGFRSLVVNAPVTHPAAEIDGAILPGYIAPETPTCHPPGLIEEVRDVLGSYRIYTPRIARGDSPTETVDALVSLTRSRGQAFRYLASRFDPDFGFLQFQQTDTVFHEFPGDLERAREIYEAVDDELGTILSSCSPDTVFVVSDHGMAAYDRRFRVNVFLREHGYIESKRGGPGMPSWETKHDGAGETQGVAAEVLETFARAGVTSQRIGSLLAMLKLRRIVERFVPPSLIRAASEQVDFPRSTAYMRSRVECGVRLNVEGREPDGVVPAEEYDTVRDTLIELLASARTEEGDPVFEDVAPREKYFHGPFVEKAVDIVTIPNDFRYYLTTWLVGDDFEVPDGPAWDHTREGVIAAAGAGIDPGGSVDGAHLFDIAPTVLASMGVPASDRMDGRVLDIVDPVGTEGFETVDRAVRPGATSETVEERLADLGYLEEV